MASDQQVDDIRTACASIEALVPAMLDAAAFKPQRGGTSKQPRGVPGGVAFHSLRREVAETLFGYAKDARDAGDPDGDVYSNAYYDNARRVASQAEPMAEESPRPCAVHSAHESVAEHLRCLADRLEVYCRPPAPREFTGPCPALLPDGSACGTDFRASAERGGSCEMGHALDADLVRYVNLRDAQAKPLSLRQASELSKRLAPRQITVEALRLRVKRGLLPSTKIETAGTMTHYVVWPDVVSAWGTLFAEE